MRMISIGNPLDNEILVTFQDSRPHAQAPVQAIICAPSDLKGLLLARGVSIWDAEAFAKLVTESRWDNLSEIFCEDRSLRVWIVRVRSCS